MYMISQSQGIRMLTATVGNVMIVRYVIVTTVMTMHMELWKRIM